MKNELIALIKEAVAKLWPLVREEVKKAAVDMGKDVGKEVGKRSFDWLIDEIVRGLRDLLKPMPLPPTDVLVRNPVPVEGTVAVLDHGPLRLPHKLVFDPLGAAKNIRRSKELFSGGRVAEMNLTSIVSKQFTYIGLPNPTHSAATNIMRSKQLFGGGNVPNIAEAAKAALSIFDKVPGDTAGDVLITPALSIVDKVPGIAETTKVALGMTDKVPGEKAADVLITPAVSIVGKLSGIVEAAKIALSNANKVPGDTAGDALIAPSLAVVDKLPGDTAGDALITADSQVLTYVLGASAVVLIGAVLYHIWGGSDSGSSSSSCPSYSSEEED